MRKTILLLFLSFVLSGCYDFSFLMGNKKRDVEPVEPPIDTVTSSYPVIPIIKKPIKIEDLVKEHHKKIEQIDKTNKKIVDLEEKYEETRRSVVSESDKIEKHAKGITETLPEPQKTTVEPQIKEILVSSAKIKDALEAKPEPLPEQISRPIPCQPPNVIHTPEDSESVKITGKQILAIILFCCGLCLIWHCIFSKKNQSSGSNTGG